jgi:aminoglycoside 2'-N-acetyltransferase I
MASPWSRDRDHHDLVLIRETTSEALTGAETARLRALLDAAFAGGGRDGGGFDDDDWAHSLGGRHFLLEDGGTLVGHAAVVERELHVGGRPMRTGYVEAVAIERGRQGTGAGSALMTAVDAYIVASFELGALSTGRPSFYERLGWHRWRGPTSVRMPAGDEPTPDDDDGIMILPTPATPIESLDLEAPISCDWRTGDAW